MQAHRSDIGTQVSSWFTPNSPFLGYLVTQEFRLVGAYVRDTFRKLSYRDGERERNVIVNEIYYN